MKKSAIMAMTMAVCMFASTAVYAEEAVSFKFVQAQPEYQTAAQKLVQAYMDEHPNVTIELITTNDTLDADLQAGNIPEIFYSQGYERLSFYADYIEDLSDQPWVENVNDNCMDAISMDGKVYGWPTTYAGAGIVYNKKMFAENGWEVPKTITELRELCQKIQDAGITPFVNEFADAWLISQLFSGGGYTYVPDTQEFTDALYAGEAKMADTEQIKSVFEVIDLMMEYGLPDSLAYGWNETCAAFALEEVAMAFEGDWIWSTIQPINPEIECGLFPVPISDDPEGGRLLVDTNLVLHVGKGSKEPEAAKEFLVWLSESETARDILLNDYQYAPCFKGWEFKGTNQLTVSAFEYVEAGTDSAWWWQKWPSGFYEAGGAEIQKYISGESTAEEVLAALDAKWAELVG